MAKQHFYSRVPAKMSMYNRSDGYDTYAHSQGLERAFVEKELAAVYENKLSKHDMEAVRTGKMPRVYSQICLRSGETVQACITYLPRDYTGERSAYLCHSLILTDAEMEKLCRGEHGVLNPEMFPVPEMDFLSSESAADDGYPEMIYVPAPAEDPKVLAEKYEPELLGKFMYALLAVFFAKGKTVYFKLPCEDTEVSEAALKFLSAVMTVIPRRAKEELSFVTYVTDAGQYPGAKFKCVAAQCPEIAPAKGVFFDLATGLVTGLPSADIMAKAPVSFFCSLLSEQAQREEFLLFMDRAMNTMPKLDKLNMKTLSDLVFLFGGASGLYPQQSILPNDTKVYDLLCVYEKYRDALSEESRRNVYKCLERYPQNHVAIPKNIFSKLAKLYPAEPDSVKRMAMHVVLELIHTDIMREKLFTFIKNNYDREDADIRALITSDLCRVFYGGFLQPQILTFFREHFANEPEQARDAVFEKLMLTIRTEAVQQQILEFLEENYEVLSQGQKDLFYNTFFEMLPEADGLAAALIRLVNGKIDGESPERKTQVKDNISALLDNSGRKKDNDLVALLCAEGGFCCDTVTALVFGKWHSRKIFTEYLEQLSQKPVTARVAALLRIDRIVSNMEETAQGKLILALEQVFAGNGQGADLYDWLEADRVAEEKLSTDPNGFAYLLRLKVTQPAIENALTDVFDTRLGKDGLQIIEQYALGNSELLDAEAYKVIGLFLNWKESVERKDGQTVFQCLKQMPQDVALRQKMAGYIRTCLGNKAENDPGQGVLYEMSASYLGKGVLLSETAYRRCKEQLTEPLIAQMKIPKAVKEGARQAAEVVLKYLVTACGSEEFLNAVCADEEGLQAFLLEFAADYGNGADKWVLSCISQAPVQLMTVVRKLQKESKPANGSLFAKLFGKR